METTTVKIDPKEEIGFMTVDETDFGRFLPEPADPSPRNGRLRAHAGRARRRAHCGTKGRAKRPADDAQGLQQGPNRPPRAPVYEPIGSRTDRLSADRGSSSKRSWDQTSSSHTGFSPAPSPARRAFQCTPTASPSARPFLALKDHRRAYLRVLYYLDDLPPERAPFRLIPRSHLSFHAQANPYVRYVSHPQEITLCAKAGSVVMIPALLFHGTHPNKDLAPRELIQFGYRPAWAGAGSADGRVGLGMGGERADRSQTFSPKPQHHRQGVETGSTNPKACSATHRASIQTAGETDAGEC